MLTDVRRIQPMVMPIVAVKRCCPPRVSSPRIWIRRLMLPVAVGFVLHRAAMLVCATSTAATALDEEALDQRVSAALRLFEASHQAAGEAELRGLVEIYPDYAKAHFYLGLLSQQRDQPETALQFYAAALRADEQHADAANNIGAVLTTLSPLDRTRMTQALGLAAALAPETDRMAMPEIDISVADAVVENLFRRTLELDSAHRWAQNNLGLHLHSHGRDEEAVRVFARALELYPGDADINFNLGVTLQKLGMAQEAAQKFVAALDSHPQHVGAAINLAALHHRYGDTHKAIELYRKAAEKVDPGDTDMIIMLRNNLGTALYQIGEHTMAKIEHQGVLPLLEASDAGILPPIHAERDYDVYVDTLVNLHRARKASCDWYGWERLLFDLKRQVDLRQLRFGHAPSLLPFDTLLLPYPINPQWRRLIAETHSTRHTEGSTVLTRSDHDVDGTSRRNRTYDQAFGVGTEGRGVRGDGDEDSGETARNNSHQRLFAESGDGKLNIGFLGHDFDEHPTAHMMEGVFVWQKRLGEIGREKAGRAKELEAEGGGVGRKRQAAKDTESTTSADCCTYSAYSYGGNDGDRPSENDKKANSSRVRESLRTSASSFVDLYAVGHGESAERIRADGVDILVDLQGHTLRGRGEIAAARPARLQVSYLVYPGTSGAPYIDYLIADRHVIPPEHATHYSESLVLLPRTYQANLYEGIVSVEAMRTLLVKEDARATLRRQHGLPLDASCAVFANFNKIDKLDPESFLLWMQILRRVPKSVLWLLDANDVDHERQAIHARLAGEAESQGVDGRRIVWAKRLPKPEHLLRHTAADLFLDTLTYGAHSTATDALAGGLPFLTLAGDSFASRVGVSLLRNAGPFQRALLVTGQREYEDLAVTLLSTPHGQKVLRKLRASLSGEEKYLHPSQGGEAWAPNTVGGKESRSGAEELPLFDTETITKDLNRAFMLMSDVHDVCRDRGCPRRKREGDRLPNIVLTGKKLG